MRFSSWTIGQQIASGFAIAVVMLIVLSGFALNSGERFAETSQRVAHTHQVLELIEQVSSTLKDAETGQRGFLLTGRDSFLEPYLDALKALDEELKSLRSLTSDNANQQRRLEAIQPLVEEKLEELAQTIELRRTKGLEPALEVVVEGRGKRAMDRIRAVLGEMAEEENRLLKVRAEEVEANRSALRWVLTGGAALTAFLLVLAGVFVTRNLRTQVGNAIRNVQSSSTELQATATQQSNGAKEQAVVTTQVASTVKEPLSTSKQIAENAQRVTRLAEETETSATHGSRAVEQAQEAIDGVKRQVDLIVTHMLGLGKKSQEIGGILDIINELAEQTNILAINATIESAGAGEHGRRFAVVAEEIRRLADRVGGSTKEIRTLVGEIRSASNTTVMVTEDGSKAVDASARVFSEVTQRFKQIVDMVRSTAEASREIELSTQQQVSAVEQVSGAMSEVSRTARETEQASGQMLQTSTELAALSRQLSRLIESKAA